MIEVADRTFRGCDVVLDGRRFVRCTFEECVLVWRGAEEFHLDMKDGITLIDSGFRFEGAAAPFINTFLLSLWRGAKPAERDDVFNLH